MYSATFFFSYFWFSSAGGYLDSYSLLNLNEQLQLVVYQMDPYFVPQQMLMYQGKVTLHKRQLQQQQQQ